MYNFRYIISRLFGYYLDILDNIYFSDSTNNIFVVHLKNLISFVILT